MRIFLDTNVVMEYLCDRHLADDARRVFDAIDNGELQGFINSCSIGNITYIAEMYLRKQGMDRDERIQTLRHILSALLDNLSVVPQSNSDLRISVWDESFSDIEDSYQYQAFRKAQCDYLVTINTQDFPHETDARIMHLTDFVQRVLPA